MIVRILIWELDTSIQPGDAKRWKEKIHRHVDLCEIMWALDKYVLRKSK
jgi:hypothetical protein